MRLALALVCVIGAAQAAPSPDPPPIPNEEFRIRCLDYPACDVLLVPRATLALFREQNVDLAAENLQLRKDLKDAGPKHCANVEVVEPSKAVPK